MTQATVKRRVGLGIKRALDLLVSLAMLILLFPLMALIVLAVRFTAGSPVLFRQPRLGHRGARFVLYKFRTMTRGRDESGELLPDERRLTRLGALLRATTLDELPELFNVLKGDMSIVGPRPLLVEYGDLYTQYQWRRHEMSPGMAGPVLCAGRNALTWEEKFALDVRYVDNWSLFLDLRILVQTAFRVVSCHGISAEGHATMPKFQGSSSGSSATEELKRCVS